MSDVPRNPTLSQQEAALIAAFRQLTPQQQQILLQAVQALAKRPG